MNANKNIQERAIKNFSAVDEEYGTRVRKRIDELASSKGESSIRIGSPDPLRPPRDSFTPQSPEEDGCAKLCKF